MAEKRAAEERLIED
jgi:hypothetical protein